MTSTLPMNLDIQQCEKWLPAAHEKYNVEEGKTKAEVAKNPHRKLKLNGEDGKTKTGDDGDSEKAEERKHRITTTLQIKRSAKSNNWKI